MFWSIFYLTVDRNCFIESNICSLQLNRIRWAKTYLGGVFAFQEFILFFWSVCLRWWFLQFHGIWDQFHLRSFSTLSSQIILFFYDIPLFLWFIWALLSHTFLHKIFNGIFGWMKLLWVICKREKAFWIEFHHRSLFASWICLCRVVLQ